jgi:hypothetical protein
MACGPTVTDVLSKLPLGKIVRARWAQSVGRYALLKLLENKGKCYGRGAAMAMPGASKMPSQTGSRKVGRHHR